VVSSRFVEVADAASSEPFNSERLRIRLIDPNAGRKLNPEADRGLPSAAAAAVSLPFMLPDFWMTSITF
jgi:hypothetical protein